MITETVLNISSNSSVSLDRTKSKESASDAKKSDLDVTDSVNLGVGLDVAEQLRNASSEEELLSLLKDGQEQAKASIDKFKALMNERSGGSNAAAEAGDKLFEAVRRAVMDVLSAEKDKPVNFQVAFSSYMNTK